MTDTAAKFSEYAHPEKLVSTQWVADHVGDEDVVVLESNEDALLYSTGHIPGARNRFFKDNLLSDGRFKHPTQLTKEFGPLFDTVSDVVMQCGSGVTACHNLLALEVAGLSGAALYPGSWSEWCADPGRPVAC